MTRLSCDISQLCAELCRWHNGKQPLRFGQQLCSLYLRPRMRWPELYYEQDHKKAFEMAYSEIKGVMHERV